MKRLVILTACLVMQMPLYGESFHARITYYTGKITSSGKKPVKGNTVAAEKKFKIGQKFRIPALKKIIGDDTFVVSDRGPAVEKRKASNGKLPVLDVYVNSHAEVKKYAKLKNNVFLVYRD